MRLNKLALADKQIFIKYLGLARRELSVYSFQNIYIWKSLFEISWALIEDNLCVFFRDKGGIFLYLPPLGERLNHRSIEEAFRIMDRVNHNREISRIENAEKKDLNFYEKLGYESYEKYPEYLCRRTEQARLSGGAFKSKRAVFNYFIKHYGFTYLPFSAEYRGSCFRLYNRWMRAREAKYSDHVYRGMLQDSRLCLEILLNDYKDLDFLGRVVQINGRLKAFTFGFKLSEDTFCIIYEITDLSVKGLAQFIFRQFCAELNDYKYINIMDDSGLDNLKKVKQSYHPARLISAYIVRREDG